MVVPAAMKNDEAILMPDRHWVAAFSAFNSLFDA